MMPLQRACDAENQARNKLSNGPLRAQSNDYPKVFCDVVGRRHLPGICWYPASAQVTAVNQGGTADKCIYIYSVLDRGIFLSGAFFLMETPLTEDERQRSFSFKGGLRYGVFRNDGGAPGA